MIEETILKIETKKANPLLYLVDMESSENLLI